MKVLIMALLSLINVACLNLATLQHNIFTIKSILKFSKKK